MRNRTLLVAPFGMPLLALLSALIGPGGCAGQQKKTGPAALQRDESRCDRAGKRVEEIDVNGDGKPDVWKMYVLGMEAGTQLNVLVCKEVDLNFDGRKDMWVHYDPSGNKLMEEFDYDFDGKIDMWVIYQNGRRVREELDTNFDGRPDVFKFYDNDHLARIERSSKHNDKIDVWEYYEGGKLDRIGYDTTGSGKPDRWDRAPDDSVPAEPQEKTA